MTDKIQEITQKIYNEGVVKAKEDARKIISEAKSKAEEIVKEAKKEETEIIRKAHEVADEIKKKTETELQLASSQFISTLKQHTNELIIAKQVENHIHNAYDDTDFIKKIILIVVQNWQQDADNDLRILLPEKYQNEINTFFDSKALDAMNKRVEVCFDPQIESGFKIGPKDGGYNISFSEKDFMNYFKRYLKERTRKLLFDSIENT